MGDDALLRTLQHRYIATGPRPDYRDCPYQEVTELDADITEAEKLPPSLAPPPSSLAPTFRQVLEDQVSEVIRSPSAAPPSAPSPLSYAEVAARPSPSTFSPSPFSAPPRPVPPVTPPDQQLARVPGVRPTFALCATSAASLGTWHGSVTVD
ncbi:hypothetical protein HPB50_011404 [Hyalomma asiaticum]|uniref:Uncharacterized protein n=1 Tax=Hyalomma asiaticum TaxID=266040 RepID=A0ACB7SPB4_HYAAI|nr:hypothetical protein HPB50_011404 [Hyalomma asiaticum]